MNIFLEIPSIFGNKAEPAKEINSNSDQGYDVTGNSYDRYGNFNGEQEEDYSDDVVIKKLQRMLP